MAKPAFSERGDAPTDHERTLLAQSSESEPRHVRQLWLLIAQRIGADALCVLFDEIGGMTNLSVPTRGAFFRDLYRQHRDAEIHHRRSGEQPETITSIARDLRLNKSTVSRVCANRVTRNRHRAISRPCQKNGSTR